MALYTIEHDCGHESEQQIYGTNVRGERERKAEWLGTLPCPRCRQHEQREKAKAAAKRAKAEGWPELNGTVKQVRWAQTIRSGAVDAVHAAVRAAYAQTPGLIELSTDLLLRNRATAAWWITNREARDWFAFIKKGPASIWGGAVAEIPAGATLAEIERDFEQATTIEELNAAAMRATAARHAGQLTEAEYATFPPLHGSLAMRLAVAETDHYQGS